MSLATLYPNLRSAFRQRLLTLVNIDHAPGVSVTLASGVFTRASGSWLTAGFAPGMEVTVIGFGAATSSVVESVTALALKTSHAGAQTVAGGGQFVVGLPQGRAWTGETFHPIDGRPYVAEAVLAGSSRKKSHGGPNGQGAVIEHTPRAVATLFYPNGKGTLALEAMAGAVMAHFLPGSSLSYGADAARITDVSLSIPYLDGSRLAQAVSVELLAFTQN